MSLVGKTLNQRFYILKPLVQGGFGHTYLAEDRSFKARHICVVKHLSPAKENLPYLDRIKELFDREAAILAKLSLFSNLIPKLIDKFQEDEELYLTPGTKLTQVDTIELIAQILTPLKYCHDEGLVHRDLNPDNIMRRSQTRELVLIDFGIAKDMGAGSLTRKSYGGTPGYEPEEQQYGLPEPASDVYAVGKIAIQALTGLHPTKLRRNPQTSSWEWRKYCNVTDGFVTVLDRMVEPLAERRYQNAQEGLAAVESLLIKGNTICSTSTPNLPQFQPNPVPVPQPKLAQPTKQKFRFETAKLEIITKTEIVTKKEIVTKQGFLGFNKQVEVEKQVKVEKPPQVQIIIIPGEAEYITENFGDGVKLEMVYIKAGSFMMGSNYYDCEKPIHQVNLSPFYMGRYTITQQQYQTIMGTNPAHFKGDNRPVECVSWDDAIEFCQKLSQLTRKQYTLPSESEWEYACRAGTATSFCFGGITPDLVNCTYGGRHTYDYKGEYREQTTNVGSFPPNAFGLYDMHGNVWEWCLDTWHDYTGSPPSVTAWIQNDNDSHLLRGGSWNYYPSNCRSATRCRGTRGTRNYSNGFRIVCLLAP
jgi:eukaryotic-like serine/threonine-protein kinase